METLTLPKELIEKLTDLAEERGQSITGLLMDLIDQPKESDIDRMIREEHERENFKPFN